MRLQGLALTAFMLAASGGRAQPLEVVSALGPEAESRVLDAVRRAREAYAELGLSLRKPYLPTRIVLVPTVIELAPHIGPNTGRSRAFSFAGNDRNSIVLAWTAPGDPLRAAAHEYAHLVDPLAEAPIWFREGLAEYLSYLERDADGRLVPSAPARHVVRLRDSAWLPFGRLWSATRSSPTFAAPTFYAQSWLVVHWLASRGAPLRQLRPEDLDEERARLGPAGVEAELRAYFSEVGAVPLERSERPVAAPAPAPEERWRVELALAEIDRELDRTEEARAALRALQAQQGDDPRIAAALGALAMDEGRYDEAESRLRKAAEAPDASARTRYRLALMLLRPSDERTRARARTAAEQTRLALERFPSSPDYRLALAQALMVDEQWDGAAGELNRLPSDGAWRERAEREMEELLRRRQQSLASVAKPAPAESPEPGASPVEPLEAETIPPPPKPPPAPAMTWPPPGATILAGRIDFVDCSGLEKIIVMRHPLLTLRIREPKGKPAKLFHPPEKWTEIPCGAKGWTVNIAYYPTRNDERLLGDAAAILF